MKRIIFISLSILLGLIFIFSAYIKLYLVELFELTFVDIGIANWFTAPYMARLLIATEFFIGFLLIMNLYLNKFTLKLTIGILVFFTLYLIYLIISEGNAGNCKCFGNFISFTPIVAIIKNLILLLLASILYRMHLGICWRFKKILLPAVLIVALILPFVLNPVDLNASERLYNPAELNYDLGLDVLYGNHKVAAPKEDLRKGKHIVAFMSLTCQHCRIGAYKLYILKKRNPEIPTAVQSNSTIIAMTIY